MILLFNLIGLIVIILIVWWFWLSKPRATKAKTDVIKILVKDGVYSPARVKVQSGQPIIIEFIRKDKTACSEYVIFDDLNKQQQLPFNQAIKINLGRLSPGTYSFACQMKMYTGELIVT